MPLFPDWKSRQLKYNFGFPKNVESRTEPLRLDLIPPASSQSTGNNKGIVGGCEASEPPAGHPESPPGSPPGPRPPRHLRGNGLRSRRRHAREEIKGGAQKNFLRLSRRCTAGRGDVYSRFNHTLGLRRGSVASLEDLRALYRASGRPPEAALPAGGQEV